MAKQKYRVTTRDLDKQTWTPQKGVRSGPYTLFGLREPLRKLRQMGYSLERWGCVMVERI